LPVIADPSTSPNIKRQFQQVYNHIAKQKGDLFIERKSSSKCSDKTFRRAMLACAKYTLADAKAKKIVVIVNQNCFSACVWTRNFLAIFPNTVIIG